MAAGRSHVRQTKGALLIIGILILSVVLGLFAARRQKDLPAPADMTEEEKNATITLEGIHHTDIREGKKDWLLEARSAVYQMEEKRASLSTLRATFYTRDGVPVSLSAASGTWKMDSNDLEVHGNVVLKNEQYEMQTEALTYMHAKRMFLTRSPVTIHGATFDQKANGMTYLLDSGLINFEGDVEVDFANDN